MIIAVYIVLALYLVVALTGVLIFGLRFLKFWGVMHLYLVLEIFRPFLFPVVYLQRKRLGDLEYRGFWYGFINTSEPRGYLDNWYGIYESFKKIERDNTYASPDELYELKLQAFNKMNAWQKFKLASWWNRRNSFYNLKLSLIDKLESPVNYDTVQVIKYTNKDKEGKPIKDEDPLFLKNKKKFGISLVKFLLDNGRKEFRGSATIKIPFGLHFNFQLGHYPGRYDVKLRFYKIG